MILEGRTLQAQHNRKNGYNPLPEEYTMRIVTLVFLLLTFSPAAEKRSFQVNADGLKWEPMNPPGVPKGLTQKLLHENKQNQLMSSIVRFPKGYREPRHYHKTCGHSMYILQRSNRRKAS